jgi:hypothetical protein
MSLLKRLQPPQASPLQANLLHCMLLLQLCCCCCHNINGILHWVPLEPDLLAAAATAAAGILAAAVAAAAGSAY